MPHKKDILLILALLFLAGLSLLVRFAVLSAAGKTTAAPASVRITQDGRVIGVYPLDTDAQIPVESGRGYNLVVIEGGTVSMAEADCPDRYCVLHGALLSRSDSIICLPHRLIVEYADAGSAGKEEPDAISR